MKSLSQLIKDNIKSLCSINERLIINKNYKSINNNNKISEIINYLFDNYEYSDIVYEKESLYCRLIIEDMIDITFEGYKGSEIRKMKSIVLNKNFKFMQKEIISSDKYKRALRKQFVDVESEYNDEIDDLYKLVKEDTSEFTTQEVDLLDNNVFTFSMSEQFIIVFINNRDTTEMFDLFIIEL